jgi:methionyl-tRNA formyltransferase
MRIVFIGTGEIGVPTLQALLESDEHELVGVVTGPDKPVGRDQRIEASPIKKALAETILPILQPARIKESTVEIGSFKPDVVVVMAYGQILPGEILKIPAIACLNLHASLLPRHRGASPIQAAIAAGDRETGITVMYMNEGLDTGDILLQRKIDIRSTDTGGSLHDRLGQVAPEALLESLRLLADGNAPRISQDNSRATYAPKLDREHGRIDWAEPAEVIERKIRAFDPWPGAVAVVTEKSGRELKLKIFSAEIVEGKERPGEVLCADNRGLIVATGEKAILLREVQLEGKGRMSANDFVRGYVRLVEQTLK